MDKGVFELKTGEMYIIPNYMYICHACGGTAFSPIEIEAIPTDLCVRYADAYQRFFIMRFKTNPTTFCKHMLPMFGQYFGGFMTDPEYLPTLIKYPIIPEQPDTAMLEAAWKHAVDVLMNNDVYG